MSIGFSCGSNSGGGTIHWAQVWGLKVSRNADHRVNERISWSRPRPRPSSRSRYRSRSRLDLGLGPGIDLGSGIDLGPD